MPLVIASNLMALLMVLGGIDAPAAAPPQGVPAAPAVAVPESSTPPEGTAPASDTAVPIDAVAYVS